MEEIKPKEIILSEDISGDEKKVNKGNKEYKSDFTNFNEQEAKKSREEIEKLMKKNEEIKKKLENLST